jgi:hypothetical protein
MHYLVTWDIDVEADTPREAAMEARDIQLRSDSVATVFVVKDDNGNKVTLDLEENQFPMGIFLNDSGEVDNR